MSSRRRYIKLQRWWRRKPLFLRAYGKWKDNQYSDDRNTYGIQWGCCPEVAIKIVSLYPNSTDPHKAA